MVNTSRRKMVCIALALSALSMSALAQDSEDGDDEILAGTIGIDISHYSTEAAKASQDANNHVHDALRLASYKVDGGEPGFPTALSTAATPCIDDAQIAIAISAKYSMATPPATVGYSSRRYQPAATIATPLNVSGQANSVSRTCDIDTAQRPPTNQDSEIAEQADQRGNAGQDIGSPRDAALPAEAVPDAARKPITWMW